MKIARLRTTKDMTQAALALLCGTSQQQIAKIEGAAVDPRLSTLRRIADALGCEVRELFYTPQEFLSEIKKVIKEHRLEPENLWDLNEACQRKGGIPSYEPLWERIELIKGTVKLKEKKNE